MIKLEAETQQVRLLGTSLQICLVGANGPETVGGLASYMRGLADGLSQTSSVTVAARFSRAIGPAEMYAGAETPQTLDNGRYQTQIIAPRAVWRPALRRLISLVARPRLQPLARRLYCRAYGPSLSAVIPASADVVHYIGTGWELLGFAALAEARKRGAAFTVWPAVHPGTWGDSSLDILLYNKADAVFVQSHSERVHLIQQGVTPERLRVCGLAPAPAPVGDGAVFRRRHGLGDRHLILFVGRKDHGKGYHALREGMAAVLAAVPDACLVAIGPDCKPPYPPVPETALLDLGVADEAEKADALAACDVFCLPSAHESFGIVYVEAWAYGKPVVVGPAPAVQELIAEGEDGFCVSQDKDAIAGALVRLLHDPTLCRRLGDAGRRKQQEWYTWPAVLQVHQQVFEDAAAYRRRGNRQ